MRLENTRKAPSVFGRIKLMPGINEIADDDFYSMMRFQSFSSRILSGVFKTLDGFDIYRPPAQKEVLDELIEDSAKEKNEKPKKAK